MTKSNYMTVHDLIDELSRLPADAIVIIDKATGGDGDMSPLTSIDHQNSGATWVYEPETTWCGRVGLNSLTDDLIQAGWEDEDIIEDGIICVVLGPAN